MTSKELVDRAIRFESVPRVPVTVLDGYLWMMRGKNMSFQDLFDMKPEDSVDFILGNYEKIRSDMVYANAQAGMAVKEVMGGVVDCSVPGAPPQVKKGSLSALSEIKNFTVSEVFEKTVNNPKFKNLDAQLELMNKKVGSEKYILAFGTGPLTCAAGMVGMENLMMALMERDEDLERMLDFCIELTVKLIDHQLAHGATAISIADPLSSINLISGELFEEFSLPGLKRITAELRGTGAPSMLHICGDTTSRLKPLIGAGYDIFSVDAVDLASALDTVRGHYAIFGNLNTVEIMLNATSQEVRRIAGERCKIAGLGGGFILAPGCDLPPDTPLENVQAMVSAAYGE